MKKNSVSKLGLVNIFGLYLQLEPRGCLLFQIQTLPGNKIIYNSFPGNHL